MGIYEIIYGNSKVKVPAKLMCSSVGQDTDAVSWGQLPGFPWGTPIEFPTACGSSRRMRK